MCGKMIEIKHTGWENSVVMGLNGRLGGPLIFISSYNLRRKKHIILLIINIDIS